MTAVIRLEDIMKTYVMGDAVVHALDHVSVEIGVGEFTSIMGPSGSGKSTMMNILGCLDRPTSGQYYLDGKEVAGYSDDELARTRNAKIGFVFQNFNLLPRANALKNVMVPLIYGEEKTKNAKERAMEMLAMVGMGNSSTTEQDVETAPDEVPAALPDATQPPLAAAAPSPPASPSSTAQPSGEHFMAWLKQGIATRRLIINDAKALVHTVSDTAYLVSPGVFQRYAQEHPQVGKLAKQENLQDWQWVQKRFEKLQLHRKQPNGLNIWTCEVTGPRKSRRLHGYLLEDGSLALAEIPPNNPYLALTQEG